MLVDEGIMLLKPALSVPDQIKLLQQRGLLFKNISYAESVLSQINYYRFNIYFHKHMVVNNQFMKDVYFDDIAQIYENDSWLRNKILRILEPIEISIKTHLANYLGMTYGSDCFSKIAIFQKPNFSQILMDLLQKEVLKQKNEAFVVHHNKKYGGKFPAWVIVELLSFNTISRIFSNLLPTDKRSIAQSSFSIKDFYLESWLHSLSVLRNICAHYGYIYNRSFSVPPALLPDQKNFSSRNDTLFTLFLVMKRLTAPEKWEIFIADILEHVRNTKNLDFRDYGFPYDWETYLTK
jgi:abortive infection bacteriophage resistance protein